MKQSLQLRIGQSLTMTPQLQQAIKLLQLSSLELQAKIQQTIDENPLLEQDDDLDEINLLDRETIKNSDNDNQNEDHLEIKTSADNIANSRAEQTLPEELDIDAHWDEIYDTTPTTSQANHNDNHDMFEDQSKKEDALKEHLLWQLNGMRLSETDYEIGFAIIDSTENTGYLNQSLEDIYNGLKNQLEGIAFDEVEAVLNLIQHFDPIGVSARTPAECMLVQLQQYNKDTPHLTKAIVLVDQYLKQLASHDIALLKRRLQATDNELRAIIKLIQTTNPNPGYLISENNAQYIVPDIYVNKHQDQWSVSINRENTPRLRINDQYARLIKRADSSEQNTYLKDHLQEARWFIKSLQSRNDTLLRVSEAIVKRQHAFLDYGDEAMQPMVLRDIAELLEMHESTVSRVTTNKFIHTPRGILEFKFFFSSHVSTADGGECSATAIRAIIKKLVAAELQEKPLSDNKIALLLGDKGINVARRTVAKYREALHIPPSNQRKRLF